MQTSFIVAQVTGEFKRDFWRRKRRTLKQMIERVLKRDKIKTEKIALQFGSRRVILFM